MKALCKKSTLGKLLAISVVVSLVMAARKYFSRRTHTAQDTLLKKALCSAKEDAQARSLENIRKRRVERREWAMPVRETEDRRALDRQGNSNSTIQSSSGSQAVPILAKETEDNFTLDRQDRDSNTVSRSSGSPAVPILAKETEDNFTLDRQDRDSDTVSGSSGSPAVPMPDKRKNSLFIEEEKKKQNLAKYYVDIAEEELNREIAFLEKLNEDIDKSWSIFIEVGKKLDSTRQRYIESVQTHKLIQEKESSIKEEICNYYRKEINTQIPTGIDLEYDEQIKRIGVMKEELDKMCSDQIKKWDAYKAYNKVAISGLKKDCDSREEKIKYFSILMLLEERLAIPMEYTIEVNNKVYDEGKMLLSAREKEAEYFKKNNEGKESETLNEILEMHTKHIESLEKMNGLWIGMCNIQKDLLSEAREKYKAYVAYDIANTMYENEKKVFYKRKDELARAEEALERHNSRIYSAASS
ncbi:hypothetical protein NEAUS06_2312 [Nematocida ausubeli]|nr:hypothetical protein NEAUS06_2312 [Nematocida ausubeli]